MEIVEREATEAEFRLVKSGFTQHAMEHGNPDEAADRVSFVGTDVGVFAGFASGLAYKKSTGYADWFFLSDLFVEKPFRRQGVGRVLLTRIEQKAASMEIGNIWTWTAGYEAPDFYQSCVVTRSSSNKRITSPVATHALASAKVSVDRV